MIATISSVKECLPKTEMTEKEFFAKLDESIASAENGNCDEMGADESGEEFLERILCCTK